MQAELRIVGGRVHRVRLDFLVMVIDGFFGVARGTFFERKATTMAGVSPTQQVSFNGVDWTCRQWVLIGVGEGEVGDEPNRIRAMCLTLLEVNREMCNIDTIACAEALEDL